MDDKPMSIKYSIAFFLMIKKNIYVILFSCIMVVLLLAYKGYIDSNTNQEGYVNNHAGNIHKDLAMKSGVTKQKSVVYCNNNVDIRHALRCFVDNKSRMDPTYPIYTPSSKPK